MPRSSFRLYLKYERKGYQEYNSKGNIPLVSNDPVIHKNTSVFLVELHPTSL